MAQQQETAITQVIHFHSTANNIQIGTEHEFVHVGKSSGLPDGMTELRENIQEMNDKIDTNHVLVMKHIGKIFDKIKYHDMDITSSKDLYKDLSEDMVRMSQQVLNQKTSFQTQYNYLESDLKQKCEATDSSLHAQRSLQNQLTESLAAIAEQGILINSLQAQCVDLVHSNEMNGRLIAKQNTDIQANHHQLLKLLKVMLIDTEDAGRINEIDVCPACHISKKVSNPSFIKKHTSDWRTLEAEIPRDRFGLMEHANEWVKDINGGVVKVYKLLTMRLEPYQQMYQGG